MAHHGTPIKVDDIDIRPAHARFEKQLQEQYFGHAMALEPERFTSKGRQSINPAIGLGNQRCRQRQLPKRHHYLEWNTGKTIAHDVIEACNHRVQFAGQKSAHTQLWRTSRHQVNDDICRGKIPCLAGDVHRQIISGAVNPDHQRLNAAWGARGTRGRCGVKKAYPNAGTALFWRAHLQFRQIKPARRSLKKIQITTQRRVVAGQLQVMDTTLCIR